jgi:hypothetical protein
MRERCLHYMIFLFLPFTLYIICPKYAVYSYSLASNIPDQNSPQLLRAELKPCTNNQISKLKSIIII